MSKIPADMAKVTQMLDAGWDVRIQKDPMGSYTVTAVHEDEARLRKVCGDWRAEIEKANPTLDEELLDECCPMDHVDTADFTPEQALTRMAYRVLGQHWEDEDEKQRAG